MSISTMRVPPKLARLATTTKYGIKQIKRVGRIEFTNERPADYWAERGYDWYSEH